MTDLRERIARAIEAMADEVKSLRESDDVCLGEADDLYIREFGLREAARIARETPDEPDPGEEATREAAASQDFVEWRWVGPETNSV